MRKVILSMMVSIDGYMESRDPTEYWTTWDEEMALFAGANLAATFIEHNLIDEYRLILNPIVLAEGKPLFRDRLHLTLQQARTFSCGNVILYYKPVKKAE
jgi:dihydrofolate reductase